MRNNLGALTERSGGMVGQWGNLAFKTMSRLDGVRTKAQYLVVGREKFNALIFPVEPERDTLVGITFDRDANPREIFAMLIRLVEETMNLTKAAQFTK